MLNKFKSLFVKNKNAKILKQLYPIVKKINDLESEIKALSNQELQEKTTYFKNLLQNGAKLDDILPEAFAVVREASVRTLGLRHFDVQLIGGIVLHNNMIAEMLTGEGKTLVSTLPAYLNALSGKGVHIVTVNEYLAKRDSEWMGQIFKFLGLKVGYIYSNMQPEDRKQAYLYDITYGTNNEFAFDYLRDNMKLQASDAVQKPFNYVIIDEVDSVLIDEARVPLIISGPAEDRSNIYKLVNGYVKNFNAKEDYIIDEKNKTLTFSDTGLAKAENLLKQAGLIASGELFDANNIQLYHFLLQACKAHEFFVKDVDYVVQNKEVVIIDEFTGRMMEGRRYSDGMHQALEAKENLPIRNENQTLASITFQNYFKLYPKICGMTGTASTEAEEFIEIYGLVVVAIPSNIPVTRKDMNDAIYLSVADKDNAIITKVAELYKNKQPVLIGTISIERSEAISKALTKLKIPHNILNAKHHQKEASIISQAGIPAAVTIATNMAGRGTDIKLGGNAEMMIADLSTKNLTEEQLKKATEEICQTVEENKKIALQAGGLYVIGTERHESRRIDNQLRGRAGRQGEPGASVFYISLEDDLMRIFGTNKLEGLLKTFGFKEGESISHPMISRSIEKAQKRVEVHNFDIRKMLLKYDNVINEQRTFVYEQRELILSKEIDIEGLILESAQDLVQQFTEKFMPSNVYRDEWDFAFINTDLLRMFNVTNLDVKKLAIDEAKDAEEIKSTILQAVTTNIYNKKQEMTEPVFVEIMQSLSLQILDFSWKRHLLGLDHLRGSINLRAYANKDPLNEYQKEAFVLFSGMLMDFRERLVGVCCHIKREEKQ